MLDALLRQGAELNYFCRKCIEQPLHTLVTERLSIGTVCDGCGEEIPALRPSRYQYRSGTLHCAFCAGLHE